MSMPLNTVRHRSALTMGLIGAAIGLILPLLIVAFANCCYEPQHLTKAEGPPPQPRFVDKALAYAYRFLWPTVAITPPTIDALHHSKHGFYYFAGVAIIANSALYRLCSTAAYLMWSYRTKRL